MAAPNRPVQAHLAHQALHGAARHRDAFAVELLPHLAAAVDLEVRLPDPSNLDNQRLVAPLPRWPPRGIVGTAPVGVVGRRGDRCQATPSLTS